MPRARIKAAIQNGIADVGLCRPEKRNALDLTMFEEISELIENLSKMDDLRCVVISGFGEVFCAGIDLSLLRDEDSLLSRLSERSHREANIFQQAAWGWRSLQVPVISAVHGVAFGGGCQVMLGADIRIAAPDTRISFMEVNWGLLPDMAAFPLLRGNVRDDVARELVFTARTLTGVEAMHLGLVTRVDKSPKEEALRLAGEISSKSPEAVRAAKRIFNASMYSSPSELLLAESFEQKELLSHRVERASS